MRLSQIAKLLDIRFNKNRGEREKMKEKKKKKTLEAQQNSDDNTTNTVGKIVIRKIQ
jgi:hypothetical protein